MPLDSTPRIRFNWTASCVLRDINTAFFSFQMSYGFTEHAFTNFTYMRNKSTIFSTPIFTKRVTAQQHYVQNSFTEFQQNRAKKVESADENSFTPLSKAWFSLGRFSRNPKPLNIFFCVWSCLLYQTANAMENVESFGKLHLHPEANCGFYCAYFHALHGDFLYRSRNIESNGTNSLGPQ